MGTSEAEIDLLTRDFAGKEAKRSWFEEETPRHVRHVVWSIPTNST